MEATRTNVEARFWAKVDQSGDCWTWMAARDESGYGVFTSQGTTRAHRYSYEIHVGPIPEGFVIDHLCRNRACVNPGHLEAVTSAENTRRGIRCTKGDCTRGHMLAEPNLVASKLKQGHRNCLACARAKAAVYRYGGDVQMVADEKYAKIMRGLSDRR